MYRDYREIELNGLICFKNQLGLIYIYILYTLYVSKESNHD